jgi:hypothetical protein
VIVTVERSPAAAVLLMGSGAALVMVLCATTGAESVDVAVTPVRFSSEVKASLLLVTILVNWACALWRVIRLAIKTATCFEGGILVLQTAVVMTRNREKIGAQKTCRNVCP